MYGVFFALYFQRIDKNSSIILIVLFSWWLLGSIGVLFPSELGSSYTSYIYNSMKLMVWGVLIVFVGSRSFDGSRFVPLVINIALICTLYIFLQAFFAYILGFSVSNGLDLWIISANYDDYYYSQGLSSGQVRLASIWFEPAQYASYTLLALICLIFYPNVSKDDDNKVWKIILLSLGLVVSTSSAAIFWLMIVITLSFVWKKNIGVLISLVFIPILIFSILNFSILLDYIKDQGVFGYSIYLALNKLSHWEESARLGASFQTAFEILNYGLHKYVGIGIGSESILMSSLGLELQYLNSFSRVFIWSGILGVSVFILIYFYSILINYSNKLFVILFSYCFFSGFYSTMWTSPDSILYLSLAIYSLRVRKESIEN
ncbi:hypothetical protein NL53_05030 [Vibrio variabilis]|uniref:O-antigen polymerase n=2 Tax=Vibrio variabilis TaxID=990271 RepID=A0ABR4YDW6_9VIBR|nr:hypothetical protein NL53_05030 [Vibrio variabilis]